MRCGTAPSSVFMPLGKQPSRLHRAPFVCASTRMVESKQVQIITYNDLSGSLAQQVREANQIQVRDPGPSAAG